MSPPLVAVAAVAAFIEEDALRIRFRTNKLEKQFQSGKAAIRAYGPEVAKRYVQRIVVIQAAEDLEELKGLPALDCHPLKGNRDGQWALSLNGFYRLVFTVLDADGTEIRVEEVSKHYDD
ncbi:MAG: type II toxin-antitoxin system RelE/ParE family toxin [Thioalkalivibrio sp.]|nr:type II toxin-antitoxin system RelE/ParE family toxin [Thioalkalivibrio sp.]